MGKPSMKTIAVGATCALIAGPASALAGSYVITSTKQIKPSVRRALKGNRGPQGIQGQPGPQGPQGIQGVPGLADVTVVEGAAVVPPGAVVGAQANCPPGLTVIGTGYYAGITYPGFVKSFGSFAGGGFENDSSISENVSVQAICARFATTGATVRTIKPRSSFQTDVDQMRQAR